MLVEFVFSVHQLAALVLQTIGLVFQTRWLGIFLLTLVPLTYLSNLLDCRMANSIPSEVKRLHCIVVLQSLQQPLLQTLRYKVIGHLDMRQHLILLDLLEEVLHPSVI
jgi:hypothetical protein